MATLASSSNLNLCIFMEGSAAVMAMNFLLNLVKPAVPFINAALMCFYTPEDPVVKIHNAPFLLCNLEEAENLPTGVKNALEQRANMCDQKITKEEATTQNIDPEDVGITV